MKNAVVGVALVAAFAAMMAFSSCSQVRGGIAQMSATEMDAQLQQALPHKDGDGWLRMHMSRYARNAKLGASHGENGLCMSCHKTAAADAPRPLRISCGASCHDRPPAGVPSELGKLTPVSTVASACRECHEEKFTAKVPHSPASEGSCDTCHEVQPQHIETGDRQFVSTDSSVNSCYQCHERQDTLAHKHEAVQTSCVSCHNPHGESRESLLRADGSKLCFQCHEEPAADQIPHTAVADGKQCLNCHQVHSSQHASLLVKPKQQLCASCHDKLPLTGRSTHRPIKTGKTCMNCHDVHWAKEKKLLVKNQLDLCLSCHANIKKKIEGANVHMPASGGCTDCHVPHASEHERLLNANFSTKDYTRYEPGDDKKPNSYALCFNCHDQAVMEPSDTSSQFRNETIDYGTGIPSLHYIHVTNATATSGLNRGRSCKVCHDPHGGNQLHLIRDTIGSFGAELKFEEKPAGGDCASSCHGSRPYSRKP